MLDETLYNVGKTTVKIVIIKLEIAKSKQNKSRIRFYNDLNNFQLIKITTVFTSAH